MNQYQELEQRQKQEFKSFPLFAAFTQRQFEAGMKKLGLTPNDTDKILKTNGSGFIRKTDKPALVAMLDKFQNEVKAAIEKDLLGIGFILDMFTYELENHEYCYTNDAKPALEALALTEEQINADTRLRAAFDTAKRQCRKQEE